MKGAIKSIDIRGIKSIRELKAFELSNLNIIIGANGAGKSNLVQVFQLLMAMTRKNLQKFILENGGADNFLHNGPKNTPAIKIEFEFAHSSFAKGSNFYRFELTPTVEETFLVAEERKYETTNWHPCGSPSFESRLYDKRNESISHWMVYHFHDTSATAPMRRSEIIEDNRFLRNNGSNIAPFLLKLKNDDLLQPYYQEIVNATQLVIQVRRSGKGQTVLAAEGLQFSYAALSPLRWFHPFHLSCDGTAATQSSIGHRH